MTDAMLMKEAIAAAENAMPAVSEFPVGAALLCADGRVFRGCNIESPSVLQVFCAERVALLSALAAGARDFRTLAVYAPKRPGIVPCGLCRQMLAEFAPSLKILLYESPDSIRVATIGELFPESYVFP
jgi:cytidine deaminase